MIKTRPVRGIVPVVDTPLTADEDIDGAALKRLIEFLNAKKIMTNIPTITAMITLKIFLGLTGYLLLYGFCITWIF